MGYWAAHTYLGVDADRMFAADRSVSTATSTECGDWAARHLPTKTEESS